MLPVDLGAALRKALPAAEIRDDQASCESYGRDWTDLWQPRPTAVVFPHTVEEVAALVQFANEQRVGLVPSGGRTGLSGGAVAAHGEIVVAFDRMERILDFSRVDRTVRVEAGVVTRAVQEFALRHGLFFPVDFASAGSSRIGGNLATNAGGTRVVRWGMIRDWVAGLRVITGKGNVLELNRGLVKNAAGYDLRHLFIGSEGTLGFIVEALLRLAPAPGPRGVLLLAVREKAHLIDLFCAFRDAVVLNAYEFFSDSALKQVLAATDFPGPLGTSAPFYALVDFETEGERGMDAALEVTRLAIEDGCVIDTAVATDEADARRLWRLRESITEVIASRRPYKNDLSVVPSKVPEFLDDIEMVVVKNYPGFEVLWYGHIGDGNLHLNVLKPDSMTLAEFRHQCEEVNEKVFQVVNHHGGSISAEHGVGLLKKPYLGYSRSADEIAYLREIKSVFDPNGIMNPGKLV